MSAGAAQVIDKDTICLLERTATGFCKFSERVKVIRRAENSYFVELLAEQSRRTCWVRREQLRPDEPIA